MNENAILHALINVTYIIVMIKHTHISHELRLSVTKSPSISSFKPNSVLCELCKQKKYKELVSYNDFPTVCRN